MNTNPLFSSLITTRIVKDVLLFYSKAIDLFSRQRLKPLHLTPFDDHITQKYSTSPFLLYKFQSYVLYYKAEADPSLIPKYNKEIEFPNHISKAAITRDHLILLYNIIEFEERFRQRSHDEIQELFDQLSKFDEMEKSLEEYLLFEYYSGVLHFKLGNNDQANITFMSLIIKIDDETGNKEKNDFMNYLILKYNIYLWKIAKMFNSKNDSLLNNNTFELISLSNELYDKCKSICPIHASKIGIVLFDLYLEHNEYYKGCDLLNQLYKMVKKEAFNGNINDNVPELFLQILSRLGYINVVLMKTPELKKVTKKLQKNYTILEQYLLSVSKLHKLQFGASLFILNYILGNYKNYMKDQMKPHLDDYTIIYEQGQGFKGKPLQEDLNKLNHVINLYALNSFDYQINKQFNLQLSSYIKGLRDKELLSHQYLTTYFFAIYNKISNLTKSLMTDTNKIKQKEYINNIKNYCNFMIDYVKIYYKETPMKAVFQTIYFRHLLTRVSYCRCCCELFEKNIGEAQKIMTNIDNNKIIYLENDYSEYSYIIKLHGDIELKNGNYLMANQYYQESLKYLINDEMKALVLFNIGVAYYCLKDVNNSKMSLNLSLSEYQKLIIAQPSFALQEKITKIEKILKDI